MLPKIFIASPLFNPPQIELISEIEGLLQMYGFDFYSARLHSGSDKMSPEQRKDIRAWDPVFKSNIDGLNECQVMIAVLEYRMPETTGIALLDFDIDSYADDNPWNLGIEEIKRIELPDAGTVWEAGYFRAQGKLVLGFHSDRAKHLNLMLTHGCDALVRGINNLDGFLSGQSAMIPQSVVKRSQGTDLYQVASQFDWTYTESWDAANKVVE